MFGIGDVIFLAVGGAVIWIIYRVSLREPILPWKEKKKSSTQIKIKSKNEDQSENEDLPHFTFRELLDDIEGVEEHMLRLRDHWFVLFAEVQACNYFLLSQSEQEAVDAQFETWLAQLEYPVMWYLQNRYVDLSEPIEEMRKTMQAQDDLPPNTIEYGASMIRDLEMWQNQTPRYETKRYILFPYRVNVNSIEAESEEEFKEKVLDKAFQTLYRRFNTAKSQLRRAHMDVELLTNEGIVEVLYHAFNRRKAIKNKFKDIKTNENLSLYSTADRSSQYIEKVKGMYEDAISKGSAETKTEAS